MVAYLALTGYQRAGSIVGGCAPGIVTTGVGSARVLLAGRENRKEEEDKQYFLEGKPSAS